MNEVQSNESRLIVRDSANGAKLCEIIKLGSSAEVFDYVNGTRWRVDIAGDDFLKECLNH